MPQIADDPGVLRLEDFGGWSPAIIYGLAMRGLVVIDLPIADPSGNGKKMNRCGWKHRTRKSNFGDSATILDVPDN